MKMAFNEKFMARTFFLFFSASSLSAASGGALRNSGPPTPTDDGADDACVLLLRDDLTGEVSGVVAVFTSVSLIELSFACTSRYAATMQRFCDITF